MRTYGLGDIIRRGTRLRKVRRSADDGRPHFSYAKAMASQRYEIRIRGQFSPRWHRVFSPFVVVEFDGYATRLSGLIPDEAALHGLFRRFEQNGVSLVSVNRLDEPTSPGCPPGSET